MWDLLEVAAATGQHIFARHFFAARPQANAAKSNWWRMSDPLAPLVTLRGSLILLAQEFKQPGVGVRVDAE